MFRACVLTSPGRLQAVQPGGEEPGDPRRIRPVEASAAATPPAEQRGPLAARRGRSWAGTSPAGGDEQDGGDGVYIDRKGVNRRTGPSASFALSSAPGSPSSSLETNPVARIAAPSSPRFAACSRSASESLYRSRTMHSD